jgi:rare lipoprotein A
MRSHVIPRAGGLAGALCITAITSAPASAQAASAVPLTLKDASLSVGQRAVARGRVAPALAGQRAVLEHRAGDAWQEIGAGTVAATGRYRLRAPVPRSGMLRVTVAGQSSAERAVHVRVRVDVRDRRLQVTAGRRAAVSGVVRPGVAGLSVALEVRRGGHWEAIDSARTRAGGAYSLSDRRRATMSASARVRVSGTSGGVASSARGVGRLDVYRRTYASWYGPGLYGNRLGCGGRLGPGTLGVAHKSLPCGTQVTFRHGGRTVRVPVIDRGPYVGGREYDLTAATARRLGFRGHGNVLATR